MRASPLSVIAVVALLVLSGCVGLPNAGENQPPPDVSPDEFPNASEIDQSVFDTHATEMGNTSFTLTFEQNRTDRNPSVLEDDFSHMFGVAFAIGLLTSKRRYLEMGAAGTAVGGVSAVLSNAVLAIAGSTQAVLAVGVTVGLVGCLLGYYFGRDLRNGLTQDIK